jgi:hypothetical protein
VGAFVRDWLFYVLCGPPDHSGQRYVSGADVLTVSQGGQALDVHPKQFGERLRLGLTQLRELGGDLLHGTVPLTELLASRAIDGTPVIY